MFKVSPASLQYLLTTRPTLTPSIIPNYNYVIMVSDRNCLKYICVFLYCNHLVHRDFLITLCHVDVIGTDLTIDQQIAVCLNRLALGQVSFLVFRLSHVRINHQCAIIRLYLVTTDALKRNVRECSSRFCSRFFFS
jgi:hypothetical protein